MYNNNIQNLVKIFNEQYNKVIGNLYEKAFQINPQAFRFSDLQNVKIYVLELNRDFFPTDWLNIYLVFEKNGNNEIEYINANDISYYKDFSDYNTESFEKNLLSNNKNYNERDFIFSIGLTVYSMYFELSDEEFFNRISIHTSNIYNQMMRLVSKQAKEFQKHSNLSAGYYAKNATKYAYSLLDLQPIIDKVNDEDFTYQMDQAIAAYDQSLYLPSCATLGVALETICKKLLIHHKDKVKDSDATMLDKLGERLKEKNIINYKFKKRLDICYKIRNMASHTSPGIVLQSDCHVLISTIHEIVSTYYKDDFN